MSPSHSYPFKTLCVTLLIILALIVSHPESATAHFHPYVSEFQYNPEYHPSRNPDCTPRWFRHEFNERQFEHNKRQHFSLNQDRPWIEIKAVLVRCSRTRKEVGKVFHKHKKPIQKCRKKVIISMKINNVGKTNTREEFVLVDHVVDLTKMHKIRLHNPYVIKIRQESLMHLYELRFQGVINAEAREEVINNRRANFSGCNDGLDNPTCGAMLINGEPIPFSQGFCCSCEDESHARSFHSAKLNYYQRDDSAANSARNRSESSANLFDNLKAQRQIETSENEKQNRRVESENARGRVTSRNISAVNGPLGERAPLLREDQGKLLRNNSVRHGSARPLEQFSRVKNADRAQTLAAKNVFFDAAPNEGKIEAYIDAVYEQAMKKRATKQENKRDENTSQNPITKLTKLESEQKFGETYDKVDNRKFLEIEKKNNESVNFSGSKTHRENARNRFSSAVWSENTSDCAPTSSLAIHSSQIPEESRLSRHTSKNASSTNKSLATIAQFLTSSGLPFESPANRNINYAVTPSMKSNGFEEDVLALLSKIASETRSSTANEEQRYKFRASQNIADNVALKNAPTQKENLSAAAIRNDNASGERGTSENANVSTRISTPPAFTRLRNLSSFAGVSRLEKLSVSTARLGNKSLTKILESRNRSSLPANEIQGFSDDFANSYESWESRRIYNNSTPESTSTHADLKNSYKFRKPSRLKLWKSKDARKFRSDKDNLKHFLGKSFSTGELIRKKQQHAPPGFERDKFSNKFSSFDRERRFQKRPRRHLRTEKKDSRSSDIQRENENSQHETQVFVDYPLNVVHSKRKSENRRGNGSLKKQVILEPGYSYRKKVRPIESDNPFLFNESGKESNVDKRIEDKFARISNVLKEDFEARIIQETPQNSEAAAKSEVAKVDVPKTPDELRINNDLFLLKSDKSDEPAAIRRDRVTQHEYPAELISTPLRSMNESFLATAEFDEVFLPTSLSLLEPKVKLSPTVIGPFLSSPIIRKFQHNVSKKVNFDKPERTWPSSRKKEDSRYTESSLLRNSENNMDGSSERSQQNKEEIAELVDRIVRQYAAYTPIMPGMPTFDEITEAETLPPEEETTVTQFTTTLATTTKITDVAFRPSIRPLQTTSLPEELHEEISLDEETEVTTTGGETTIPERKFQTEKLNVRVAKTRKISNKTSKNLAKRVTSVKLADAVEEVEDHPWYRTTKMQQITANSSKSLQTANKRKKQRSKVDYLQNSSSGRTASTIVSLGVQNDADFTETRSKRSDFIRESSDFPVFYDYEEGDEENRQSRRAVLNKNEEFPNMTWSTELQTRMEKRLTGELDYPASPESLRHSFESRNRIQKHNVTLRDGIERNVKLCRADLNEQYFNSDVRKDEREENTRESLKNFTSLRPRNMNNNAIDKFDEDISPRNRETVSVSKGLSGLSRAELAIDRKTAEEKRAFGERAVLEIDEFVMARKIAAYLSGNARTASANDLSNRRAEPQEESTGAILRGCAKSLGDRDKSRGADTVVHSAKLMMADDDKGDTRDLNVAAKSIDKKTRPLLYFVARQRGRENVRKINENPADSRVRRVSGGKEYLRRSRDKVYDTIRKMIEKIKKMRGKSSSISGKANIGKNIAGRKKRADRPSANWHRSGRRLLSSGKSVYIENDEYYEDDEKETDGENDSTSGNEPIARSDDLSGYGNQPGLREDRDLWKLVDVTDRSASENAASTAKKRTIGDAAMISDDLQAVEISEAPFESEEPFVIKKNTADNIPVERKKHFDDSENALQNFENYEEEVDEEPLSFREEQINGDNIQDESLYETPSIFPTEQTTDFPTVIDQNLSSTETFHGIARSSSKDEGSIKISLTGRIQVNGAFNQTPVLISFDAIPDRSPITQSLTSTELSNVTSEATVINLPFNDSDAFDLSSITERANDEANNPSDMIPGANQEAGKTNTNEVVINSREKFFHLARKRSEKERGGFEKTDPSQIEKRLDKYNSNSGTAKQVFPTDYSNPSIVQRDKMDGTNVRRKISERLDEAIDKLDPPSLANSVPRFPNILGSVLVSNDSLKNPDTTREFRYQIDNSSIKANRSCSKNNHSSTLRVVPSLLRIRIEKPANIKRNKTECCEDSGRNATSGGCYGMPVTVRKLELPGTTSHELQTWSNYRDSDPVKTFPPAIPEATANQNMETTKSTLSAQSIFETTTTFTNETLFTARAPCSECNDESSNAIRVKNMMAIVRFMTRLLRIITEDEESPCSRIGETSIRVNNVVVNVSSQSRNGVGKQRNVTTDRIMMTSERTRQDLTSAEWQSTITESIREKSLPSNNDTFESFTEAPATSTLPTSSDKVFKDENPSTLFETTTRKEVHASASSSTSPESFLFYEPVQKSPRKDASRKNTSVDPTDVKQNSNVSFAGSKENSGERKSRLDDSQTNGSSSRLRRRDRSSVDRLHFDKQEIASTTNFIKDKIKSFREDYLAKNKSVANDTIRSIRSRDTLKEIGVLKEDKSEFKRSKQTGKTRVSDRQATRTKLLNRSAGRSAPGDWIGRHRAATRQLPVDKKLRESREVTGGTATPEKVVFRRVRGKINRPRDPNLGEKDSFKIEGQHTAGRDSMAKLLTDDYPLSISEGLSSSEKADFPKRGKSVRYLSIDRNNDASKINEEMAEKRMSAPSKKRDVGERRDFQKGNRVFRKREKIPTKKKTKWQKKKKRKKGAQRTKNISGARNQRFKRHLLMMSPEQESGYDADYAMARLFRRYKNVENLRKSARENAKHHEDGSRTVDESEVDPVRAQIRGGQDCTDRRHPPNIDAAKYLESAHCLRFSDLWYSVYQLKDPIVEHTVYLQVYEKRALANGSTYWKDLTGDSVVRLGTFNRHRRGSRDTIAFSYKEVKTSRREEKEVPNLDVVRDRLLVPSSVTSKDSGYPVKESDEYLVVPASSINEYGNECDKAGVGFAAFAKQPDRCGRVRGTCLKNQPLAFRRHDVEARAAGRPGCYFLSNFASVPSEPIKYSANGNGSREFLALEYHSPHVSAIDIEVRASYNAALVSGSFGRISKVYVDSTALDHTVVTVVITNTGLTSTFYRSKITDCPDGLPESWVNVTFPRKIVLPQRDQPVSLNLYGELPRSEFYCSVQLQNRIGELVASRRIKIRKMDRCSCVLHCLCVCVGDTRGTGCRPMSPKLYHAAGFRGSVPAATRGIFSDTKVDVMLFVVSLMFLLLFMGLLKWIIGLRSPAVGRWGLDSLLECRRMSEYLERELKCKCVVTDEHGAPVHPETRKRTVRICSRKTEFFLNATFFLIFPFAVCCYRLKKLFRVTRRRGLNKSEISSMSDKTERPETICVSTYGDNRDSQMEAEDTKYVMDELKKSEELLRNHSRSGVSDDTKNHDISSCS